MEYVLEMKDLKKNYGHYRALQGVTMRVPRGSIYGLVGRNGAGKTTLFRQICGLQAPTSGEYSIYGVSHRDREILKARRKVGALIESPSVYLEMSAQKNLKEQYRELGLPSFQDIPQLLALVGLGDTGKKKVRHFSSGMRQRLGIAVALAGRPDFLILDEPLNGLDPQGMIEMREILLRLNKEYGTTILISSHILDNLAKVATHFGFLDQGVLVQEIDGAELRRRCRKRTRIAVTDIVAFGRALDEARLEYIILSDTEADVYGEIDVTGLVTRLAEKNCNVTFLQMQEESLENYFLNLVGGGKTL